MFNLLYYMAEFQRRLFGQLGRIDSKLDARVAQQAGDFDIQPCDTIEEIRELERLVRDDVTTNKLV